MWEFFEENINNEDRVCARFKNEKGHTVYLVHALRDGYAALTSLKFIESKFISYSDNRKLLSKEEEELNGKEFRLCELKHACEYFEEKYNEQVERIKLIIL